MLGCRLHRVAILDHGFRSWLPVHVVQTAPELVAPHAQVQTLPPEFDVRGARPTALGTYGGLAQQARDAFARGAREQPDEWVLHLYLGKACAFFSCWCNSPLQRPIASMLPCLITATQDTRECYAAGCTNAMAFSKSKESLFDPMRL